MTDAEIKNIVNNVIDDQYAKHLIADDDVEFIREVFTSDSKIGTFHTIFKDGFIPVAAIKPIINDWQRLYTAYLIGAGLSMEDAKPISKYLSIFYGLIISTINLILLNEKEDELKEKV